MDHDEIVSGKVIGCAIEVHRQLGPGLLENAYHTALCIELAGNGVRFVREPKLPLVYDGIKIGDYRPGLIVEDTVVVEVKSVLRLEPVFIAQMLTYLRVTSLRVGLILNFNRASMQAGIKRVVL